MKLERTNFYLSQNPPLLIADVSGSTSWDEWLSETETKLKERGYIKYVQNHKNEDFCYWKTFKNGEDNIYQVGIPMVIGVVIFAFLAICAFFCIEDVFNGFFNPEYWALSKVLSAVK